MTQPPHLDPIQLDELTAGEPGDLVPQADLESVRFESVQLPTVGLRGATFDGVRIDVLRADEADLSATRFRDVLIDGADVPVVKASRSTWRDMRVSGRWGSVEAYEAEWRAVLFIGCKLSYVNLRDADLTDVALTDCQIDELDLIGATARRVAMSGTRVSRLDVQRSELEDVDLRGVQLEQIVGVRDLAGTTITSDQLALLSPLLADELGIAVAD